MSSQISAFLPYLATILSIGVTLGGLVIGLHGGYSKEVGQIQERVITALKQEIDLLKSKVEDVKEENRRLERILEALIDTLKSREIYITIQGQTISIREGKETIITWTGDEEK